MLQEARGLCGGGEADLERIKGEVQPDEGGGESVYGSGLADTVRFRERIGEGETARRASEAAVARDRETQAARAGRGGAGPPSGLDDDPDRNSESDPGRKGIHWAGAGSRAFPLSELEPPALTAPPSAVTPLTARLSAPFRHRLTTCANSAQRHRSLITKAQILVITS